jgi:predicted RNA binding protein YcfA (HicA-like mRNA interferase family)
MLFLKSTSASKAPGIYEVDIAAKPPGKTFGVYMATDPDKSPTAVLSALSALGFEQVHQKGYKHRDGGKVLDVHYQKKGTDLFEGWTTAESAANLDAIAKLFSEHGIAVTPRVMSLSEAYA